MRSTGNRIEQEPLPFGPDQHRRRSSKAFERRPAGTASSFVPIWPLSRRIIDHRRIFAGRVGTGSVPVAVFRPVFGREQRGFPCWGYK